MSPNKTKTTQHRHALNNRTQSHRAHSPNAVLLLALLVAWLLAACAPSQVLQADTTARVTGDTPVRASVASEAISRSGLQRPLAVHAAQATNESPLTLVQIEPDGGALRMGETVVFTFDRALAEESEQAFSITPALAGDLVVEQATIRFTPTDVPTSGEPYQLRLDGAFLRGLDGAALSGEIDIVFTGATPLMVTSIQPGDGAEEVTPDGAIVIVFNRPVVPLGGIDDASALPFPLGIEPVVEGAGEWLNTSIFTFRPTHGFAGSTRYSVTVSGVTGLDGAPLDEPVQFSFTTAAPIVTAAQPTGDLARPDAVIEVEFSQTMDLPSTDAAFRLTRGDDGTRIDGALGWSDNQTHLTFTPTQELQFGTLYSIHVDDTAQPSSRQGSLRAPFRQDFQVVPLPLVQRISPVDGAQNVSPDASVVIKFNTAMSETLVLQNVAVTPVLTTTQVYSYYSWYVNELQMSWFKEPNTTYTITVGAGVGDEYGNVLGEDQVYTFTTGDYAPVVQYEIERFTHFASGPVEPRASLLFRNVDAIEVDFYRLPLADMFLLTGMNQWQTWDEYAPAGSSNQIWSRVYEGVEERNVTIRQVISLTSAAGDSLPPGIYYLESPDPGAALRSGDINASPKQRSMIVLSDYNLLLKTSEYGESLVWLTELTSGDPVAGETVTFYIDGSVVGEAVTDADGIARSRIATTPETSWRPIIALAGAPGAAEFAMASNEWNSGIAVWDFELMGGWGLEPIQQFYYTDRAVYRAGQTVYWKGILRALEDDEYRLPSEDVVVRITVNDDQGNIISEFETAPSAAGTLFGQIELSPEATSGFYYLQGEARIPGRAQPLYGSATFQVADFRTPEFLMTVTTDEPEYVQGDTIRLTVQADYFSGGPVAAANVTWRLISEPYRFTWTDQPQGRLFSFEPFDIDDDLLRPYSFVYLGLVREGTGRTNADGTFTVELPADLASLAESIVPSQNWVFDITIQTPTNQFVSGRSSVPVHSAAYYLGLSPRTYVIDASETQTVDLVSIQPDGTPYPAADVEITVYELQWNNVYARAADGRMSWNTSVTRRDVSDDALAIRTVRTDRAGASEILFSPPFAGQFEIVARGADEQGNATSSSVSIWVTSPTADVVVEWPRANNDRIELIADRDSYAPGDTARILVASPFSGTVNALLTVERGGVLEHSLHRMGATGASLEIPITEEHIPNIYISVVLIKGVDETNPVPAMRIGYAQAEVDTSRRALTLAIEPSAPQVAPGATITYTLTARDYTGAPVPDAEISLAVVDKAVLLLGSFDERSLMQVFYSRRPLDIRTSATLIINQDRMSQQLSEGAKGGGGGDGMMGIDLREEFSDVAYWQADAVTDANGQIVVSLELPDNLTTWTLVARGVTAETLVGDAQQDVIATKALQVRPRLPRFFTAGDRAQIGAAILNTTASPLDDIWVAIEIEGAQIDGAQSEEGDSELTLALSAGDQAVVTWPVTVDPAATEVVITLVASQTVAGGLTDAVRIVLPVVRHEAPETVATAGEVSELTVVESIRVPVAATDNGTLDITLEPSLAAALEDGLGYLTEYPFDSTEHTISRFLPNLFNLRALRSLDIQDPELEAQLAYHIGISVQRLVSRQNQDGGWGFWRGERSNPFITTYALWGLHQVRTEGFAVPVGTVNNALAYLERQFVEPARVTDVWRLNEMAFAHFVLSELDEGDPGRMSTLFDSRERLGNYGKAFLAMALDNVQPGDARAQTLLDDLYGAANLSATGAWWSEDYLDYRTLNTNTRTTAIVLAAFVRLDPYQPINQQAIRWLMHSRQGGHWSTTQETAWTLIALTDWLVTTGELRGEYGWEVSLNDELMGQGNVDAATLRTRIELQALIADLLRDPGNLLAISRDSQQGRLYYTVSLRYYLDALAIDARDRGIVVDRRFELADASAPLRRPVNQAQVGDIVSVTVTIVAPTDLHHLAVRIPVPAGLEPIDPALLISPYDTPMLGMEPQEETSASWRAWRPVATDFKSDAVTVFATYLQAGAYEYSFTARAATPGEFRVLPAYAELQYFSEVWGRSPGALFTVTE